MAYYLRNEDRYLPMALQTEQFLMQEQLRNYERQEDKLDQISTLMATQRAYGDQDQQALTAKKLAYESKINDAIKQTNGDPTRLTPYLRNINRQFMSDVGAGDMYEWTKKYNIAQNTISDAEKRFAAGEIDYEGYNMQKNNPTSGFLAPRAIDYTKLAWDLTDAPSSELKDVDEWLSTVEGNVTTSTAGHIQMLRQLEDEGKLPKGYADMEYQKSIQAARSVGEHKYRIAFPPGYGRNTSSGSVSGSNDVPDYLLPNEIRSTPTQSPIYSTDDKQRQEAYGIIDPYNYETTDYTKAPGPGATDNTRKAIAQLFGADVEYGKNKITIDARKQKYIENIQGYRTAFHIPDDVPDAEVAKMVMKGMDEYTSFSTKGISEFRDKWLNIPRHDFVKNAFNVGNINDKDIYISDESTQELKKMSEKSKKTNSEQITEATGFDFNNPSDYNSLIQNTKGGVFNPVSYINGEWKPAVYTFNIDKKGGGKTNLGVSAGDQLENKFQPLAEQTNMIASELRNLEKTTTTQQALDELGIEKIKLGTYEKSGTRMLLQVDENEKAALEAKGITVVTDKDGKYNIAVDKTRYQTDYNAANKNLDVKMYYKTGDVYWGIDQTGNYSMITDIENPGESIRHITLQDTYNLIMNDEELPYLFGLDMHRKLTTPTNE